MSTTVLTYLLLALVIIFSGLFGLIRCFVDSWQRRALSREQILTHIHMEPAQNFSLELTRLAGNRTDQDHSPECLICISEFVEGDHIRILSRCRHGFHVNCIEKWLLANHSSCPTCRASCRRVLPAETCQQQQQPHQQQTELQIQEQEQHPQEQEQPLNDVVDDIESYYSVGNFSGGNIYSGNCN